MMFRRLLGSSLAHYNCSNNLCGKGLICSQYVIENKGLFVRRFTTKDSTRKSTFSSSSSSPSDKPSKLKVFLVSGLTFCATYAALEGYSNYKKESRINGDHGKSSDNHLEWDSYLRTG